MTGNTETLMNPECAQGKHRNCDGVGLDMATDQFIECKCVCHDFK